MIATEPAVYSHCGLRIRSELELALPIARGDAWDVDVVWGSDLVDSSEPQIGEHVAAFELQGTTWYTAIATPSGFRLRFRASGEFVVSDDLTSVVVHKDPAGRTDLIPILLAGTVSAFVLALRGETVLHASAVAIDGASLAFVGQSGRGKSTLAALMCIDGAALVADDLLTLGIEPPPVRCTGGAVELRLRPAAAGLARSQPGAAVRTTADERSALALPAAPPGPLPLAGIVIPAPSRTISEVAIQTLPPSDALVALLSFPRIHGWRSPDVLSRDFATLSRLVNLVPVYAVTIPWGPPFDPSVARCLSKLATGEYASNDPA